MKLRIITLSLLFLTPVPAISQDNSSAVRRTGTLEEVVVTARKREENIQETPLAITALSGQDLKDAGIENVNDLSKSVPSLQINKGQSNQIYIRGIGERTGFVRVDPTVGVYMDGLFLPRADGQLLDTLDVSSLQVLRGPQGTLFGKNTTGGALVLTLEKPGEVFEGYIETGLGNYATRKIRGAVNLPISDTFFARISGNVAKNDGYLKDSGAGSDSNSSDGKSILLQTRWDASDAFTMENLLFYGSSDEIMTNTNCNIVNDDALFVDGLALLWAGDTDASQGTAYRENCESNSRERQGDLTANKGENPRLNKKFDSILFGATGMWNISEDITTKAVLGLRSATEGPIMSADNDGGPEDYNEAFNIGDSDRKSASLELQLNGTAFESRLNYTTGFFFAAEANDEIFGLLTNFVGLDATSAAQLGAGQDPTRPASPLGTVPVVAAITGSPLLKNEFTLKNQSLAAFFQASYDFTEAFQGTFGVRWTEETRVSELKTVGTDLIDVQNRLLGTGRFAPLAGQAGFYTFNGAWLEDPVRIASNLYPDADGDGIPDFVYDEANPTYTEAEEVFRQVTPMVSLSYSFDDYVLKDTFIDVATTYLTWSSGFKSGFSEPRGVDGLARIEPEEVENLELGLKTDLFDSSMRFNVAAYRTDYKNIQLITVSSDTSGNLIVVFTNAGQAVIEGAEMELSWLPLPGTMITLNYSNNNYYYEEFTDTNLKELSLRQNRVEVDRSGEPFPATPGESASLGLMVSFPSDFGVITPRLDISYKGPVFFGLDASSAEQYAMDNTLAGAEEYVLADFRLSWLNEEGSTRLTAYVKNITDERFISGTVAVADSLGTFNQSYGDPRLYGLDISYSF
jgi:iron complex outermembrane receptor protein